MRGCQLALVVFIIFAFGIFLPVWLAIIHIGLAIHGNYENNWFRTHGSVETAVVVDKRGTHLRDQVIVYQVQLAGTNKEFREAVGDFDLISVGDQLEVWVAGDNARMVQPDFSLITTTVLWFLVFPVIAVAILFFIVRHKIRKAKAERPAASEE